MEPLDPEHNRIATQQKTISEVLYCIPHMRNSRRNKSRHELVKDFLFIFLGAILALALSYSGIIDSIIELFGNTVVASFVAGVFFTSVFTIAPASVALAHIAFMGVPLSVALWGAFGAMCGDLVLFFFIRDRFTSDLLDSVRPSVTKHILSSFHLGFMKWLSPLLGALIIASPLPDELGLTLMGLSKMRVIVLIPISFVMNILGIYLIIWLSGIF